MKATNLEGRGLQLPADGEVCRKRVWGRGLFTNCLERMGYCRETNIGSSKRFDRIIVGGIAVTLVWRSPRLCRDAPARDEQHQEALGWDRALVLRV